MANEKAEVSNGVKTRRQNERGEPAPKFDGRRLLDLIVRERRPGTATQQRARG